MVLALRYRRVSGESQEENSSLEKQLERINAYCTTGGYETPADLLFTEVMTGVETWRLRVELNKLFKRVEELAGVHQVVVVDHPDRLARGLDLILIIELLRYYGARVEFVQQKFEDTDEGELVLHFQSYSSKQEWKRIKKRTHDGMIDRVVKDHKPLGSIPLYGYQWDDPSAGAKNRYVYNDAEIHVDANGTTWSERKVVEFLFQKAKEGWTLGRIAKTLNDLGVPTRQRFGNNVWTSSRISEMLADPKYMGRYYALQFTSTQKGDKVIRGIKPLEECILMPEDVCPPIVDAETWQIVQAQLDYNKKNSIRNARFPEKALCRNGIARCGYCGGAMNYRGDNRWQDSFRYFCIKAAQKRGCSERNTIMTHLVDEGVWRRCCEVIRDPAKLRASIEALRTPDPTGNQSIPVSVRKKQVEDDIAEYVDLLHTAKKETTKKNAHAWIKHLEDELEEIEQEEKIIEGIRKNWQAAEDEIKKFEQWCIEMREHLAPATYSQKRTAVEFLGVRVRIFKFGSRPRFTVDFAPPKIVEALAGMKKNGTLSLYGQTIEPDPVHHVALRPAGAVNVTVKKR